MHLHEVTIENFRSIKQMSFKFDERVNLLIGPNAAGKTSVLEAIRLAKALLAPRTASESQQLLIQLGAGTPNLTQALNFAAIMGDINLPLKILCSYKLNDDELSRAASLAGQITNQIVAAMHGMRDANQQNFIQFMSTPLGQQSYNNVSKEVAKHLGSISNNKLLRINLTIDPKAGQLRGMDSTSQAIFSAFEGALTPYQSLFSYFPADRALPQGEAQVQMGAADAQQQVESHNSQPQLKYQRLKSTIFASYIQGDTPDWHVEDQFKLIFSELIIGRQVERYGTNAHGQAQILIKDQKSGASFDIDAMSSGEKGLILTFLIIGRAVAPGGVILIDEPELHLNSAVCRELLNFMIDRYLAPKKIQAIICTHSPEILSTALRREDCAIYHIQAGKQARKTRKKDQAEVGMILRALGASELESMLYEGIVFVEGPDDVELLEMAFPETLARLRYRQLTGRGEVEKHIERLQNEEKKGQDVNLSYFVFDQDRKPKDIPDSHRVKVAQWNRYCLENFLIDPDILFDLIRREYSPKTVLETVGEMEELCIRVSQGQLTELTIWEVLKESQFDSPLLLTKDVRARQVDEVAATLSQRLEAGKERYSVLLENRWPESFAVEVTRRVKAREEAWRDDWQIECNGKQFLADLRKEIGLNADLSVLKRQLITEAKLSNEQQGSRGWQALRSQFQGLITRA
jgi:predicted ATPase